MSHRPSPRVLVVDDPAAVASTAAAMVVEARRSRASFVLGVATGATPLATYARLVATGLSADGLHLVLLDEYLGLREGHPQSFTAVVRRVLGDPLGVPAGRIHASPVGAHGGAPSALECEAFEREIAALGGVDVQILGIGRNGHVAFDEPGSPVDSRTRVVELSADDGADNAAAFAGRADVPTHAVTQGIATILDARALLLLATGPAKAEALAAALRRPPTPDVPASALQLHPAATVIADRSAAARLT